MSDINEVPIKYTKKSLTLVSALLFIAGALFVGSKLTGDEFVYLLSFIPLVSGLFILIMYVISRYYIKRGTW